MEPSGSAVSHKMPSLRRDRHLFSTLDDTAMIKQITSTHVPDGREIDAKPILHIVEDLLLHANAGMGTVLHMQPLDSLDERARFSGFEQMLEVLSFTISQISSEIAYKCSVGGEAHATTVEICNLVTNYSWDAKLVLVLAAFAVRYGGFWLAAQLYATNPLAKGIARLKQVPELLERADLLKPRFEALTNLINAMLQVAKCVVDFKDLPSQYISPEDSAVSTAMNLIPTAVYWTIRSIVASTSQIKGLVGMGHEFVVSTTEAWELSVLAHKISSIHIHLMQQLNLSQKQADDKRQIEAYQTLVRLFDAAHIDNMKILKALIYAKDDLEPILDGTTKRRVSLDLLRRRFVLLLISDLEVGQDDLILLEQVLYEAQQQAIRLESQYEMVWLPVIERSTPWNEAKQRKFVSLQASMSWYSVHHPSIIDPAVIKYIKQVWRFNKRPLVVVLDPHGKVVNPNAMNMMVIWGGWAFPFSSAREEVLWKQETWRFELLADDIDPSVLQWLAEGKYICFYGGEDMNWIRKFTRKAGSVAQDAHIELKMLYVGKSNPGEKIRRNNASIYAEKLSDVLPDLILVWYFWLRLESMWHSKVQQGNTLENDSIMSEAVRILSFDSSNQGWAVISRGSTEMVRENGEIILKSLDEFYKWNKLVETKGFIAALIDHIDGLRTEHHCSRVILPGTAGNGPDRIVCSECGRQMERLFMYRCCVD